MVFALIIINVKAQLSGTYTIGGTLPDYSTILSATTALTTQGVSGSVTFNIRNGTYYEYIAITSIPGSSASDTITFQSESGDSSLVKITYNTNSFMFANNCTVYREYGYYKFVLKNLTIENTNQQGFAILIPSYSGDVTIKNCSLLSSFFSLQGMSNCCNPAVNLLNCFVNGKITYVGTLNAVGTNFNCPSPLNQYSFLFNGGVLINNKFYGEINMYWGGNIVFDSNIIYSGGIMSSSGTNNIIIKNNVFHYDPLSQSINISQNNDSIQLINNEFGGKVNFSYANLCVFNRNKFHSSLTYSGRNALISNNFFYYDFFNSSIKISSKYNKVNNNNFAPHLTLDFSQSDSCDFKNNNVPKGWISGSNSTFSNNNYQGNIVPWDINPYNLNPNYVDTLTDLHTTNPLLIGKGSYIPTILTDIDSLSRPNPPSIGANEICLSSNSFNLSCGDSIKLTLCGFYNNPSVIWSPTNGLNDSTICKPMASPAVSTTYYAMDTTTGITDSLRVNVISFQVNSLPDTIITCGDSVLLYATFNASTTYQWLPIAGLNNPNIRIPVAKPLQTTTYTVTAINPLCGNTIDSITINIVPFQVHTLNDTTLYCGDSVMLDATVRANVTYQWYPLIGLYNPNIRNPIAMPLQTTTYTVTAVNPLCGSSIDSITLNVNPIPVAQFIVDSIVGVVAYFQNQSTCATTYQWHFGDGVNSNVTDPIHNYNFMSGTFVVSLFACNSFGCDTITHSIYIAPPNAIKESYSNNSITISPNPFSTLTTITFSSEQKNTIIKVVNVLGETIQQLTTSNQQLTLDMSNVAKGIYFVRIEDEKKNVVNRKIVVQ